MNSVHYYNKQAKQFFEDTINVDMSDIYHQFEKCLPINAKILDAGCGSGRDTKYFLSKDYNVVAIDASQEMVQLACDFTGINVEQKYFQDISCENEFDGIWSCASLLHVPKKNIDIVFKKFIDAMKMTGIWYMSFKMGEEERTKDSRLFNDYTEGSIRELIASYDELHILELWQTSDNRVDRKDNWLNIIVQKALI